MDVFKCMVVSERNADEVTEQRGIDHPVHIECDEDSATVRQCLRAGFLIHSSMPWQTVICAFIFL